MIPDVDKLLELSNLFSCTLDALLKEDMAPQADYYSPVSIVTVPAFTLGRYVIISPQPENDVQMYLDRWAGMSGLRRQRKSTYRFQQGFIKWTPVPFPYFTAR